MKNPLKNTEPIKTKTEIRKEIRKIKRYNRWINKKIKEGYTSADIRDILKGDIKYKFLTQKEVNDLLDWRGRF